MRQNFSGGSPYEPVAGYCRAVRVGNVVHVAGTTAMVDGQPAHVRDFAAQTRTILEIIKGALEEAGASLEDVVRTRIYVTDISRWEEVARAHGEVFGRIRPVTTLVEVSALIAPEYGVEIEAEAVLA
ncbi:RidA family protein [Deinococcus arenicola]|uniref:RidA family protein n=1 Tax=Deinococcus arenicola TaxID=2994950 RepID=A0ABU4DUD8_9DEIO|nr:RidA family protein [Deinococcus sp. ZS9-10]MDV6375515.1 RidA family protein [Deinococcus sp. ZS9-10]